MVKTQRSTSQQSVTQDSDDISNACHAGQQQSGLARGRAAKCIRPF